MIQAAILLPYMRETLQVCGTSVISCAAAAVNIKMIHPCPQSEAAVSVHALCDTSSKQCGQGYHASTRSQLGPPSGTSVAHGSACGVLSEATSWVDARSAKAAPGMYEWVRDLVQVLPCLPPSALFVFVVLTKHYCG